MSETLLSGNAPRIDLSVPEEWNATEREYPKASCVHELFEAQTRRTPDASAVVHGERSLTYAELNAAANRLAHALGARKSVVLKYADSGDVSGDKSSVVGYMAAALGT